ncbi:BLUF domain-containing protein [Acinetobacter radioresistens]|uniref:BLUF domain-containing protein n=2 Tax=Acinetobacter radioresistens TaxID=40216 RepID=A0A2T1IVS0_ACIRA|nr:MULTISPECIES: BLUF domain-containing protein [Acinetobacter]EET82088.1 sensors of blue-light using FAD [Acinetobacter radioresistens SK82]EEY86881.1 sensors of blue-light using FAD [Acinetobacter radioresistens SH164]ENV84593.1 hypothetical protein F940_02613 [Acinetobacter radioresistens NIPH 2130]EXB72946.1 sensors of blue-light using FAD family protein [Acinetobacter sp. 230853]EXB77540.1 sensors of blue-light using FAD family protein [Acinetobacter sp. 272263]
MEDVRLLYVSKLKDCANPMNELFNILTEALNFNTPHKIYGALYYGNGYFVQCLEGEREKVEHLYFQKILKDPRHEECEVLFLENIDERMFSKWHMKYASYHKDVINFFMDKHKESFNPYLLTNETIPDFVDLLSRQPDSFYTLSHS